MSYGDKSVSPCVYTPETGDAASLTLENGLYLMSGKIRYNKPTPVTTGLIAEYRKGNWDTPNGTNVSKWYDSGPSNTHHAIQDTVNLRPPVHADGGIDSPSGGGGKKLYFPVSLTVAMKAKAIFSIIFRIRHKEYINLGPLFACTDTGNHGVTVYSSNWRWGGTGLMSMSAVGGDLRLLGIVASQGLTDYANIWDSYKTGRAAIYCSVLAGTEQFMYGGYHNGTTYNFGGTITDLWIYDRELTVDEIGLFKTTFPVVPA